MSCRRVWRVLGPLLAERVTLWGQENLEMPSSVISAVCCYLTCSVTDSFFLFFFFQLTAIGMGMVMVSVSQPSTPPG